MFHKIIDIIMKHLSMDVPDLGFLLIQSHLSTHSLKKDALKISVFFWDHHQVRHVTTIVSR